MGDNDCMGGSVSRNSERSDMSSGNFTRTLCLAISVGNVIAYDVEVEVSGQWSYDPGCWRTANGDGWPPSFDIDSFDIENESEVLACVREQLSGECDDKTILDAVHSVAWDALADVGDQLMEDSHE
jgi:hypothetical protein